MALGSLYSSQSGLLGPRNPRDVFLDAVAADLARYQRLTVSRRADQLVVHVKPAHKTLTLSVSKMVPEGEGQSCELEWKDQEGKMVSLGHWRGVLEKIIHLDVPGLP
jgi:hypothetical protein